MALYAQGLLIADYQMVCCWDRHCRGDHKKDHKQYIRIYHKLPEDVLMPFCHRSQYEYIKLAHGTRVSGGCNWCKSDGTFLFKRPNDDALVIKGHCCHKCYKVNKWMFEYFLDKRPMLKDLTKMDYLRADVRTATFQKQLDRVKSGSIYKMWLVRMLGSSAELPRDLLWVIMSRLLDFVCEENRLKIPTLAK